MSAEVIGPIIGLLLALVVLPALVVAVRPLPRTDTPSEIAYREGRQCCTPCYSGYSAPERCVYPEDHYGDCSTEVTRPSPRQLVRPPSQVDPWAEVGL